MTYAVFKRSNKSSEKPFSPAVTTFFCAKSRDKAPPAVLRFFAAGRSLGVGAAAAATTTDIFRFPRDAGAGTSSRVTVLHATHEYAMHRRRRSLGFEGEFSVGSVVWTVPLYPGTRRVPHAGQMVRRWAAVIEAGGERARKRDMRCAESAGDVVASTCAAS